MPRRRFDHLFVELSVAAGELVPRYALWLRLHELGWDPVCLERKHVLTFADDHLADFLSEHDLRVRPRALRTLRRRLRGYDPGHPTPEEILQRIFPTTH